MRTAGGAIFRELVTGFGALVFAVIAQAVIVWTTIDRLVALDDADDEARTEILHCAEMFEAMLDQQVAINGLAISHDPASLETYEAGRRRFEAGMPLMVFLAKDDPAFMGQRVADIALQARRWTETVAKPQVDAARAGLPALRGGPDGRAQMDAMRGDFAVVRHHELSLLEQRDGLWGSAFRTSQLTLLLGSGTALIFAILLAARSLRRLIAQQRAAQAEAAKLAQALERAQAAERAKTLFLSNMSHEMRTPLNGVAGMAEALDGTGLSPAQREFVGVIRRSAASLDGLIGDLLTLSRGSTADRPRDRGPFHLGELIRTVAAEHRMAAEGKQLKLRAAVPPAAELDVIGDAATLKRLLGCLLSNAVKFTDRGEVRLTLETVGAHRYRFEVSDTGIGFDDARKAELFQMFSQSDDSATRRHGGAGLGLALARQLAADLGGQFDCCSKPGQGSAFTLDIDLAAAKAAAAATTPPGDDPAGQPVHDDILRVLVVDDNATNRTVLELILDQLGVASVSAEDGQQAVDAAERQAFAAILMDIQMPVMDGLTAIREIRRLEQAAGRPAVPVIVVSANGEPQHVQAGRAAGAQLHLTKPVSAQALIEALNLVLADPDSECPGAGDEAEDAARLAAA